jgi:tRNA1(Val) A37 N6-methylase TrmN6
MRSAGTSSKGGGIVRAPRRPPGWTVPGPTSASWDARDLRPRTGEDLCWLAGDWRILQRIDGHRWSLDDLVTAWFAAQTVAARAPRLHADLGCGVGSVLLLIAWRFPHLRAIGVEAQQVSHALARRSVAGNGVAERCTVRLGDLRDPGVLPEGAVFDLVTATPPYLPPGTGRESARVQCAPCRIEHRGGIEDYCAAAGRLLAPRGSFVTCAGGTQGPRVLDAARAAGLHVARSRDVISRAGKAPLLAVHALQRRDADLGHDARAELLPPLTVRDVHGCWTPEFRALRRDMGLP